jgi:hypothetical protein
MLRRVHRIARFALVCCVNLVLTGFAPAADARVTPAASAGEDATAATEVRLRKLHLVRPDLIPYPIAYEVVC